MEKTAYKLYNFQNNINIVRKFLNFISIYLFSKYLQTISENVENF